MIVYKAFPQDFRRTLYTSDLSIYIFISKIEFI